MLKRPFFSIVIPTYNRAADLQFALYCIFRQTFSDFEVVISDNCSNDNTKSVVRNIEDKRIRYFRLEKTVGNAVNFNNAIKKARGKYIFIHSDDDFLLNKDSLEVIYEKILKYNPGFIRLNYLSLSMDKKKIFNYKSRKSFVEDVYVPPHLESKEIISFILKVDPYFITGIIFKNSLPNTVKMIDSDPVPEFEILFYVVKNYGACFLVNYHIIANWSRRKIKKNTKHHFFALINGKLRSENYFNAMRNKLDKDVYQKFLHNELMILYSNWLPLIKSNVGNEKMLQICSRVCLLDSTINKNPKYWVNLTLALILPMSFLVIVKEIYLYLYRVISKVEDNEKIIEKLKKLELEYNYRRKKVSESIDPIFSVFVQ
ncbi:MAG: glycosyltransferase family 2 protein [Candidatus Parcubacteria bacterium]|nr:glycosyltransferase family 2 protein [Candidatus Parcubacteria bacterium]